MTPGVLRPQASAGAEIAECLGILAQFQVADPSLEGGPVMPRLEVQGLVQLSDGPAVSVAASPPCVGDRQEIMVPGARGRDRVGPVPGGPGWLGLAELAPVTGAVDPERLGGFQAVDRLGLVEQCERADQRWPIARGQADAGPRQEQEQLAMVLGDLSAILRRQPPPVRMRLVEPAVRGPVQGQRLLADGDPLMQVIAMSQDRVDQA